ncbi:hypothetical protein SLS58_010916 [Diplodia intermedia]|uniref:Uncharacterized protein n=1 Tax=Diplodia intermedia TaxID=856260 RepID=A0ABR3T2U7_9PEZI
MDPPGSAKKEKKLKGKWTEEEEKLLIKLRSSGMKWVDISQQNPGRSATACRLRYQNYTEKKEWAEDEKDMLARLYHRYAIELSRCVGANVVAPRGKVKLASDPHGIVELAWAYLGHRPDGLKRLYDRSLALLGEALQILGRDLFMEDMWKRIADEMCRPWRSCERMHWQLGEEEMLRRANVQYRGGGPTPPGGHPDDLENDAGSPPSTAGLTDDDQTASPSYQHSHTAQSPHQRAHHYHHHGPHPQQPQHSPYALPSSSHSHHALSREPSREPSRERQQQQWPPPPLPSMMPSSLPTRPTSATSTIASVGQPMSPQMPLPAGMQQQQQLRHHNPAVAAPPVLTLHQPLPTGGYHHTPLLGTPLQTPTPLSSSASASGGGASAGGMRPVTPLSLAAAGGGGGGGSSDHLAQQQQQQQQQQQGHQQPNPSGTTPRTVPTVVHGGHAGPGRLASPFAGGGSSSERPTTAGSMTDREGDVVGGKGGGGRHRHRHHHHHHHHYPHQSAGFVADMDAVQVKKEARVGDD